MNYVSENKGSNAGRHRVTRNNLDREIALLTHVHAAQRIKDAIADKCDNFCGDAELSARRVAMLLLACMEIAE